MKKKTQKVEAIHEKDLEKVLKSLRIYNRIVKGEMACFFCRNKITLENLQYIFSRNGEIVVSCNEKTCVEKFGRFK